VASFIPPTDAQLKYLRSLARRVDRTLDELVTEYGTYTTVGGQKRLSRSDASALIADLNKRLGYRSGGRGRTAERETVAAYVAGIRNPVKRGYAERYVRYLTHGGTAPSDPDDLSYMAAQAVRIRLGELLRPAAPAATVDWTPAKGGLQAEAFPEHRPLAPLPPRAVPKGEQAALFRRKRQPAISAAHMAAPHRHRH